GTCFLSRSPFISRQRPCSPVREHKTRAFAKAQKSPVCKGATRRRRLRRLRCMLDDREVDERSKLRFAQSGAAKRPDPHGEIPEGPSVAVGDLVSISQLGESRYRAGIENP